MPDQNDYISADQPTPADDAAKGNKPLGDEKDSGPDTALLPKSLFPGEPPAVGDVCQFKVEHIWEDEVEVSYQKEGAEKSKPSMMDDATGAFDNMASPAEAAA